MRTTTKRRTRGRRPGIAGLVAALLALSAFAATPAVALTSEEQQGAQLLRGVQAGTGSCASLTTTQFERIGEYVMGRMLGSSAAHEAMNRQMQATVGQAGEAQAHVYMGQRFTGCTSSRPPVAFGAMMGAGMMGSAYGGTSGSGYGGRGGMMGSGSSGPSANGSDGADTVMVVLVGVLILVALGALAVWRPWRGGATKTPLETLQARYAHGEIDQQEFDRRRQALGGTT